MVVVIVCGGETQESMVVEVVVLEISTNQVKVVILEQNGLWICWWCWWRCWQSPPYAGGGGGGIGGAGDDACQRCWNGGGGSNYLQHGIPNLIQPIRWDCSRIIRTWYLVYIGGGGGGGGTSQPPGIGGAGAWWTFCHQRKGGKQVVGPQPGANWHLATQNTGGGGGGGGYGNNNAMVVVMVVLVLSSLHTPLDKYRKDCYSPK